MLKILQVNTSDLRGGAESVSWNLHRAYRRKGHASWLAVGYKRSQDPDVLPIPRAEHSGVWTRVWGALESATPRSPGNSRVSAWTRSALRSLAAPRHALETWRGAEDFNYPGAWRLLELPPDQPQILHCHNLHGSFFDLRAIPWLSQRLPVVLTLHDAWLLSGHCAHSFACERWKTGCGRCPDLTIYPAVRRDATAFNWQRKRETYASSQLHVTTPSRWLMRKVEQSILSAGIVDARVIPNGVDLSVFHPANKEAVRSLLGLPLDGPMLLFAANGIRSNIWKDYATMRTAIAQVAVRLRAERILLVALGEEAPPDRVNGAEIRFVPYEPDPHAVARFYQAADVYVHAARTDTFPLTVLEALACGTPVVATSVGGIPEQVESGRSGFLVEPGDAQGMAKAVVSLITDEALRRQCSVAAAKTARDRFDLDQQAEAYLAWFREILERTPPRSDGTSASRDDIPTTTSVTIR